MAGKSGRDLRISYDESDIDFRRRDRVLWKHLCRGGEVSGEVVFNTSMTGYQEVLTDPSHNGQIVTMTYPLIGNYGINSEDVESKRIQVEGFVVREYQPVLSNWRAEQTLADYLSQQGIIGIESVDTRALTRHIRLAGAM
jgi:carbamoyl-phosphate synthase small subunit